MELLEHSMQHRETESPRDLGDERRIPVRRHIALQVTEVYPGFGSAWAVDERGERIAINYKSDGLDVTTLEVGQQVVGDISRFGYLISAAAA